MIKPERNYSQENIEKNQCSCDNKSRNSDEKPVFSEEKPDLLDEKPVFSEEKPGILEEKPVLSDKKPVFSEEKPIFLEDELPLFTEKDAPNSSESNALEELFALMASRKESAGLTSEHLSELNAHFSEFCLLCRRKPQPAKHVHGPGCGHSIISHQGHIDYIVEGTLHFPHDEHCDDHGRVAFA